MTASASRPKRAPRPCPICSRMSIAEHYPFCSDRCRSVDMHRWLSGSYAIPVAETDEEEDDGRG